MTTIDGISVRETKHNVHASRPNKAIVKKSTRLKDAVSSSQDPLSHLSNKEL